jgi:hypothetical protein
MAVYGYPINCDGHTDRVAGESLPSLHGVGEQDSRMENAATAGLCLWPMRARVDGRRP